MIRASDGRIYLRLEEAAQVTGLEVETLTADSWDVPFSRAPFCPDPLEDGYVCVGDLTRAYGLVPDLTGLAWEAAPTVAPVPKPRPVTPGIIPLIGGSTPPQDDEEEIPFIPPYGGQLRLALF